jgi:hypothetical protein
MYLQFLKSNMEMFIIYISLTIIMNIMGISIRNKMNRVKIYKIMIILMFLIGFVLSIYGLLN